MAIEVELPDGTIAEFPDGTDNATMERALSAYRTPQQKRAPAASKSARPNFSDVTSRVIPSGSSTRQRQGGPSGRHRAKPAPSLFRRSAMSLGGEPFANFADAAAHNVAKPFHGLANLVQEGLTAPVEYAADRAPFLKPLAASMRETTNADVAATQAWERDYQSRIPDSGASYAGAAAGSIAPWLLAGPAKLMSGISERSAAMLPNAPVTARVLSGAAQGGVIGATSPTTGDGQFWDEKRSQVASSAAVAGALPWVFAGARGAVNLVRPIVSPQRTAAANLSRNLGATQETVDKLRNAPEYVPGERPTTAQVLQNEDAAMVEKALMNNPEYKQLFDEQANRNNALRLDVLRKMAGTDDELSAAYQRRRDVAGPFRSENLPEEGSKMVNAAPVLATLTRLSKSANPSVRGAAREHLTLLRSQADKSGNVPAYALDDVRQNAGAMIAKHTPQGMQASQEATKYSAVSAQILRTLDKAIPGYRDYLAAYRANSVAPSTMESARRIIGPIDQRGVNSAGDSRLTLGALNTGLNRADKQRYGLSPQARSELENVRQSLRRESISGSVRSPGSDTKYNINAEGWLARQVLGENMSGPSKPLTGLATLLGSAAGAKVGGPAGAAVGAGLGLTLKRGADAVNKRIMDRYAQGMLNPAEAAAMIESFLKTNAASPAARQELLRAYPQWAALLESRSNK